MQKESPVPPEALYNTRTRPWKDFIEGLQEITITHSGLSLNDYARELCIVGYSQRQAEQLAHTSRDYLLPKNGKTPLCQVPKRGKGWQSRKELELVLAMIPNKVSKWYRDRRYLTQARTGQCSAPARHDGDSSNSEVSILCLPRQKASASSRIAALPCCF